MNNKIFFRADGNPKMGLGHVIRSLALVSILNEKFKCIFITKSPLKKIKEEILFYCDQIIEINENASFSDEIHEILPMINKDDIVVLDGYHFNTNYQKEIKKSNCKLVSIDDIYATHFVSNVVINHAPLVQKNKYSINSNTILKLGLDFSLLREPFLEKKDEAREISIIENVFVCFGGSDYNNITIKVVDALLKSKYSFKNIDIVIGGAYTRISEINKLINNAEQKISLHSNLSANEMKLLMCRNDMAIVPASSILYEVCSVNMFVLSGYYVDNQLNVNRGFRELGLIQSVGDFNLVSDLEVSIDDFIYSKNNEQLKLQHAYFNGTSKENLLDLFYKLSTNNLLFVRKAEPIDMKTYFDWANDKAVRKNAINQEPIKYVKHVEWFESKLNDDRCLMLIMNNNIDQIGQIRIDLDEFNIGVIDYSISNKWRGKGFGMALVTQLITYVENWSTSCIGLKARVKKENVASIKVFENLNFKVIHTKDDSFYDFELKLS